MVAERIIAAGPDSLEDNLVRILQGCAVLRQEPEFADLCFEPRPTLEAAARHFLRFRRRLMRAARRGAEAAVSAYDDYRIAVLDDLDTPQFRRQLQRRLKRCMDRLKRSHDVDKFEMALFVSTLLSDEASELTKGRDTLPLGVYGLVTSMYEDSFDRAMAETPDARDIVGNELYDLWCVKHNKEDLDVIAAAIEQVGAFEELAAHIESNPTLALAWKRQERYLIEEFQSQIVEIGLTFTPSLFTSDEVALAVDKMEQRYLSKPWSLSRYFVLPAVICFTNCIREALDEIVSPQRMAEMIERFKSAGQEVLESDNDRLRALVPHIQAAIHHLQSVQTPSRNQVVGTMYSMGFLTVLSDVDTLSPRWRQLLKRLKRSRLLRKVNVSGELVTDQVQRKSDAALMRN